MFITFIFTAQNAKESWEKLRRCFLNAINRRRAKKSGDEARKITPWKYELQMAFLLPYIEKRQTLSNITQTEKDDMTEDIENMTEDPPTTHVNTEELTAEPMTDGRPIENDTAEEQSGPTENTSNDVASTSTNVRSVNKNKKKSRSESIASEMVNVMREMQEMKKQKIEIRNKKETHLDDTDKFFLNMAGITKTLPHIEQAKLKLIISNAVFQAQIKHHENSPSSQSDRQSVLMLHSD